MKHTKTLARTLLTILIILPFIFPKQLYEHTTAYLKGNVLYGYIITDAWIVVTINIIVFIAFLIPLTYRRKARWQEYGLLSAFFISLFIEMYGIPLTILFISAKLFTPIPQAPQNVITFTLFGTPMGMTVPMLIAAIIIITGTTIILAAWWQLYKQRHKTLVTTGLYSISRHPQYIGFLLILYGWMIGWPTFLTLIFAPILMFMYVRVARKEEQELVQEHKPYTQYKKKTPFLI